MKRKSLKIVIMVLSVILMLSCFSFIYASTPGDFNGEIQSGSGAENGKSFIVRVISTSLNTVRTVGIAVAVVMLMTVACKYIMASAGDKADIKKYAFNYVIGALVLFGAAGIVTIIKNVIISSK